MVKLVEWFKWAYEMDESPTPNLIRKVMLSNPVSTAIAGGLSTFGHHTERTYKNALGSMFCGVCGHFVRPPMPCWRPSPRLGRGQSPQ